MKRSEAIKNLLNARTHTDLARLYNPNMEVQINVAQDNGERVDGDYKGKRWHGYSDGIQTWKPFRIPGNARTEPIDTDYDINYDLAAHAEGIGLTGWDWKFKRSLWVGFDFDAITGHAESHDKKLTDSDLQKIKDIVANVPWVTLRQSTGGHGLHLYVFIDPPITTVNHIEHAAVARAILGMLAGITGYDFKSKVDNCGHILWIWHRKMLNNPNSLKLLKQGMPLTEVPPNWKDHINVVSGKSKKIVPAFITDHEASKDINKLFDELTNAKTKIPLDEEHQKLIKWLHDNNCHSWWDSDISMLVTHTKHLAKAHEELGLKGLFKTISPGTEPNEQNCFMFPLRNGSWTVRRYTPGVAEANTWDQDSQGYTRCYYNKSPDFKTAVKAYNAVEDDKNGYVFREAEVAVKALQTLGINLNIPNWITTRPVEILEQKEGKLIVKIEQTVHDRADEMVDWLPKRNKWIKVVYYNATTAEEPDIGNYDDLIRHLITETGDDYGWLLKSNHQWRTEPFLHVKTFLKSLGLKPADTDKVMGACIAKPWRLVCRPFEPEILADRDWNRKAPQLTCMPTQTDNLNYPSWLKILNHLGKNLNQSILENKWAKSNGIITGADYLKCWIASLIKEPREPLPYLFFYGEQNSGKSIFHEALSLLITNGIVRADNALINPQGFNAELENCVLAIIEETDLSKQRGSIAYARIKDWTTSRSLPIHRKGQTPYSIVNTVHFIQCANESTACPVLPGDARIVVIKVESIEEIIPKKQLLEQLQKECNDFLASILAIELPESGDRLNLPVITTQEKKDVQDASRSVLELFVAEYCHNINGRYITLLAFYEKFTNKIEPGEVMLWSKIKIGRELPQPYFKGRHWQTNEVVIANMSFENNPDPTLRKLVLTQEGKIMPGMA